MSKVTVLTGYPTIVPIAEMQLSTLGIEEMMEWMESHRLECLPNAKEGQLLNWLNLFPHDSTDEDTGRHLTANELLVELSGRKCYDSFGLKAGKKSNKEYIANTQAGAIPHAGILYHAKMTFFFAGISRRVSHELIRNYVGADRDFEGSPSQESIRFTHHYGFFVCPPRYLDVALLGKRHAQGMQEKFRSAMQQSYDAYLDVVARDCAESKSTQGFEPKSMDRKRIYEAAASFLPHQAETSLIWTTNPAAIAKFVREREEEHADLEMRRFARKLREVCVARWPNVFPQQWMHP